MVHSDPYLYCEIILFVVNFYLSVELAEWLKTRQSYLVRTLRSNRKSNPKEVVQKSLKRRDWINEKWLKYIGIKMEG